MKPIRLPARALAASGALALLSMGCMGPRGNTLQEKHASAMEMRDTALAADWDGAAAVFMRA